MCSNHTNRFLGLNRRQSKSCPRMHATRCDLFITLFYL
nr:MAG TPA: hypothetical protein [Caudoviricetes sp.]